MASEQKLEEKEKTKEELSQTATQNQKLKTEKK